MVWKDMYKGLVNSPETTITNNIGTTDTIIYVLDPARVPADLPNLMVLGTGTNAETVKVTAIDGNALTVERGFQGVAKDWLAGTIIARNFTEYDYSALVDNVDELELTKETPAGAQAKADVAESNAKTYADGQVGDLAGTGRTIETVKGNADDLKTHLADKASHINGNAACRICNSVNQSIANNTSTLIAFNTEIFDNDTMHDAVTNNTRLTCKSAGKYLVIAQVGFEVNTTGYRGLDILKNGMLVGRIICAPAPTIESVYCATTIIELAVNDYVELSVFQTSGGALKVRADGTMLMAIKVG